MSLTHDESFKGRHELDIYGNNARLLYAIETKFRIDDIHSLASTCLTDNSDDKKCDLIFVDEDRGVAVIAQAYQSTRNRPSAPSNKAADLNVAAGWLLNRSIDNLPDCLKPGAIELHSAIENNNIKTLYFWYVHNLPESENVAKELKIVELTAQNSIKANFPSNTIDTIQAIEVGVNTLENWYKEFTVPILVTDSFQLTVPNGYEITGPKWQAFVTAVSISWLYKLYRTHKTLLFSANIRDYLGTRRSDNNINFGIQESASNQYENFWVYNNGLTILVNDFEVLKKFKSGKASLEIRGISIVNGAQTTGAIGNLKKRPDKKGMVPVRFVKCNDPDIVVDIIQYNNSQNRVEAADYRSNDLIQKRLREEFKRIPDCDYSGGRRGGDQNAIMRPLNTIPATTAAQALVAFHGEPILAYNNKSQIWAKDDYYARYYGEFTHANHLIFAYSLLRSIEEKKVKLIQKSKDSNLTDLERKQLEFLRFRGASYLLVAAISKCSETFLDKQIPDKYKLSFGNSISPRSGIDIWTPIVGAVIPFVSKLLSAVEKGLKNSAEVNLAINDFQELVEATKVPNIDVYNTFKNSVIST